MAVERRCSRSCGDVVGTGAGMLRVTGWKNILLVYAEGDDDVDEGDDDVGEAEALIRRDLERVPFGQLFVLSRHTRGSHPPLSWLRRCG